MSVLTFKEHIFTQYHWLDQITSKPSLLPDRSYLIVKRGLDLFVVLAVLPIVTVVFILCAILIKLEDPHGPVLFIQQRTGKGGRRFGMFKFRTMVANAEALKHTLAHLNELQWPDFKITNDPRVTKMGRFLRKTSLDELPQLINVLRGEMSLVGPRPTSFSSQTYTLWQTERLDVTPGITGLWQIMGRASMEFTDRVYLDVLYIEHRCLWLDLQILLRTVLAVLTQRGAH
ncbi:MAG: sugar transferase [Anaerolineales bacterium]|nr:sugar transferase [Anaerolineales bacterium]